MGSTGGIGSGDESFEQGLRARLHGRVASVPGTAPAPTGIIRRARARQQRQRAAMGVMAIAGLAGGGVVALRDRPQTMVIAGPGSIPQETASTSSPGSATTLPPSIPDATKIMLPGWNIAGQMTSSEPPEVGAQHSFVFYRFELEGPAHRQVLVQLHDPDIPADAYGAPITTPLTVPPEADASYGSAMQEQQVRSRVSRMVRGQVVDIGIVDDQQLKASWVEGGRRWEVIALRLSVDHFVEVANEIRSADEATLKPMLPSFVMTQRPEMVDEIARGVPLPPGLSLDVLRAGPSSSRFDITAESYGRIMCGWAQQWAKGEGTPARIAAREALTSVPNWPGMAVLAKEQGVTHPAPGQDELHLGYADAVRDAARQVLDGKAGATSRMPASLDETRHAIVYLVCGDRP